MSELMDRSVGIEDVVATTPRESRALEDDVRAALMEALAHGPMSVGEMVEALDERGIEKAPTTVRHHVDVLREAGLVELGQLKESRGGVVKYYAATTRLLGFEEPEGFEEALAPAIEDAREGLATLVDELEREHGDAIGHLADEMRPCPHCDRSHFEAYVLVRLVQRGLAKALEEG